MNRPPSDIKTSHVKPPASDREHDWCAYHDGEEELEHYGWGLTEQEAIADLHRLDDERAEWAMADACKADTCSCKPGHCELDGELNQAEWYANTYLPNVRKALRGEPVDRALLEGGTDQANDDQNWDSLMSEHWS